MNPFNHPDNRILALPAALFTVAAGLFALSNRLRQEATADIISYRADELGRLFARVEVTAERGVLPGAPLLLRDARDRSYVYVPRAPFKQGEKFDVDVSNPEVTVNSSGRPLHGLIDGYRVDEAGRIFAKILAEEGEPGPGLVIEATDSRSGLKLSYQLKHGQSRHFELLVDWSCILEEARVSNGVKLVSKRTDKDGRHFARFEVTSKDGIRTADLIEFEGSDGMRLTHRMPRSFAKGESFDLCTDITSITLLSVGQAHGNFSVEDQFPAPTFLQISDISTPE
ncbi:MAG: hypothetical protein K1X83_03565 [Oligoflexia bacterium]|nr:hypothetical protein [Oligoflexia bacterium]